MGKTERTPLLSDELAKQRPDDESSARGALGPGSCAMVLAWIGVGVLAGYGFALESDAIIKFIFPWYHPDVTACDPPVLPADKGWTPDAAFAEAKRAADGKYAHGGDDNEENRLKKRNAMPRLTPHVLREMEKLHLLDDGDEERQPRFTLDDFEAKLAKSPYEMRRDDDDSAGGGSTASLRGWLTDVLGASSPGVGRGVHYVNNPGNFGDALIACSGFTILERAGVDFRDRMARLRDDECPAVVNDTIIVYPGGGNLVAEYVDNAFSLERSIRANLGRGNTMVVLPHTVDAASLVRDAGGEVIFMAREMRSFAHILTHTSHPQNVYLASDLALSLDDLGVVKDALEGRGGGGGGGGEGGEEEVESGSAGVGNLFREDYEKTSIELPRGNYDLSERGPLRGPTFVAPTDGGGGGDSGSEEFAEYADKERLDQILRFEDKDTACTATRRVLRHASAYQEVYTNRLHMCIASGLVGVKRAYCYPGSTWKAEAVFEYSINGSFPAATFVNQTEGKIRHRVAA